MLAILTEMFLYYIKTPAADISTSLQIDLYVVDGLSVAIWKQGMVALGILLLACFASYTISQFFAYLLNHLSESQRKLSFAQPSVFTIFKHISN